MRNKIQSLYNNKQITANGVLNAVSNGLITQEEADKILQNDKNILDIKKNWRVNQSKIQLQEYLKTHPLQWTDGEYYSITDEKQGQLLATLFAAQVDGQPPEWNTTGGVCKEWKLEELSVLAVAIKNRVKAFVKYQQDIEIAIMDAESLEALDAVVVDYNTVKG